MCGALSSPTSFTFQLTAARRRLESSRHGYGIGKPVSTHSRPKAAGRFLKVCIARWPRFNSQPPEGGWLREPTLGDMMAAVSTHSRPKAAGCGR